MNNGTSNERVGWIDDQFVRLAETAQNFGSNAEVSTHFHITELHEPLVVHDGNLEILAQKAAQMN